jgi:hypothetical protein
VFRALHRSVESLPANSSASPLSDVIVLSSFATLARTYPIRDMGTLDKRAKIDDVFKSNALVDIRACNKPVIKVGNAFVR